jgi:hypothetical protein
MTAIDIFSSIFGTFHIAFGNCNLRLVIDSTLLTHYSLHMPSDEDDMVFNASDYAALKAQALISGSDRYVSDSLQ